MKIKPFSIFAAAAFFYVLTSNVSFLFSEALPVTTYEELLSAIRQTRKASEQRIEQAVRQEKVREAWETGKLIDEHVLQHKERADYDKQVILRLADDLQVDHTELYRMLKFARLFPIVGPAQQLSWSHYEALLSLDDKKEIEELASEAERKNWTRDRVREEVRKKRTGQNQTEVEAGYASFLTAKPGTPGTYRVVLAVDGPYKKRLALDLGFSNYFRPENFEEFFPGEIVESTPHPALSPEGRGEGVRGVQKSVRTASDLFTYPAYVRHVVDGDTFYAIIDLGFGLTTRQKLRLRGLDAPEIESAEGKEAKKFLEQQLLSRESWALGPPAGEAGLENEDSGLSDTELTTQDSRPAVLIRTAKSDKYDRYLVDVFVNGEHINQKLVEAGLASVVGE